jgi:hypothetical protein
MGWWVDGLMRLWVYGLMRLWVERLMITGEAAYFLKWIHRKGTQK